MMSTTTLDKRIDEDHSSPCDEEARRRSVGARVARRRHDTRIERSYLNGLAFEPDATDGDDSGWPLPWAGLRFLVAGSDDLPVFLELGRNGAELVRQVCTRHITDAAPNRVLDFGCGCGRIIRHLTSLDAEVYGCDPNAHAIRWCSTHLPFGHYAVTSLSPPLPYSDGYFGLVYAFSVFTHLSIDLQQAWLDEMRRVIAPGGLLLFSVHGDACTAPLTADERREYAAGQAVVRLSERAGANECAAFHPPSFVRAVLATGWDVVEHVPAGATGNPPQDAWVFRRIT